MGLLDLTSRVITEYKADTSDHKRAIRELRGEERKAAQDRIKELETHNAKIEGQIAAIGKMGMVIGTAAAAGTAAWSSMEFAAKKATLAAQVNATQVDRLAKGMGNLRSNMEELELANALQRGSMKLSAGQMETVGKAIRQMVREGSTWEEATAKMTDAITKLEGDALKGLGPKLREAKTDTAKFAAIMEFAAGKANKLTGSAKTQAEQLQGTKTTFKDAIDSVREGLGQLALSLSPVLEALAAAVSIVGSLVQLTTSEHALMAQARQTYGTMSSFEELIASGEQSRGMARGMAGMFGYKGPRFGVGDLTGLGRSVFGAVSSGVDQLDTVGARAAGFDPWGSKKRRGGGGSRQSGPIALGSLGFGDTVYGAGSGGLGEAAGVADPFGDAMYGIDLTKFDGSAANEKRLEKMFGPLTEFDAYKAAFDTLSGAVGSAFGAWIDGSKSAGEAFKAFIGESLKGIAVQMAMEALKHGAYALGSLAFGNLAGAAAHGKAAAQYAAGAVVVGAAAKALHGGSSPSTGGGAVPSAPSYGGASGGAAPQQGTSTTYVIGNDFASMSSRQRQLAAERAAREAQAGGVKYL